ncbi:MAG TPA: polysaccharide deacetylase family protein [Rhizomicrobium sp.]|nr:polysaccharide deacetylase family protein [Rhizomicrobium sp.]
MKIKALCVAAAVGLGFGWGAAHAGPSHEDTRIALFQARSIFHSGLRDTHTIALTFDDGPNANTIGVLNALKANNVKATFFIVGNMAHKHPEVLARIAAEGHLLANHSASHPMLSSRFDADPDKLLFQLRDVNDQIAPLMKPGDKLYFRAPYGSWRSAHAAILNDDPVLRNYVGPVYWDIGGDIVKNSDGYIMSSADWDCWHHKWSPATCAKGYLREIRRKNGGVVLMHCIHNQSAELVADVVPALVEEGYNFVRVDQIPDYRQYDTPPPSGPVVATAALAPTVAISTVAGFK